MMDYECPVWWHVAPSHLKLLQVIQSKCLRSATGAPWYVSNLQIHSDMEVPYSGEHIRSIAQILYTTFPDMENPLYFGNLEGTDSYPREWSRGMREGTQKLELNVYIR